MRRCIGVLCLGLIQPVSTALAQLPEVRYLLRARVNDSTGVVSGTAEIRYRHLAAGALDRLTLSLPYNAFRPGAADWPRKGVARTEDTGFERIFDVRVDGAPAVLEWSEAPDSSTALLSLPYPLATQDSVLINFTWLARPPSLAWQLDRRGRRLELDGWYPRVMDETEKTSVPYAAFSSVLAQLDLAPDQVIGGTGIPLCGDPGWTAAAVWPNGRVTPQHEWYSTPREPQATPAACNDEIPGLKRVAWYAEQVTAMTLVMSPTFRHEEGEFLEKPVHALYERGGERVWGAGLATGRVETAWAWVVEQGGANPWPHLTVVEGLDRVGRVAPMLLVTRTPSQAALLELLGQMTTQQILVGGSPVFTVGTAAHHTAWFFEALGAKGHYARLERQVLEWDLDKLTGDKPFGSERYAIPCETVFCRRTEFMGHQLRRWAGSDEPVRGLYHALYEGFALRPTRPGLFQELARGLIEPAPDSLYLQLSRGALYDDAVRSARREPVPGGGWRTIVEIERRAQGLFPRTVWVIADRDTGATRGVSLAPREMLAITTRSQPRRVVLDPLMTSHDWNMLNNQRSLEFRPEWLLLAPQRPTGMYLDTYFTRRAARDRLTIGWAPTVWFNDFGGWTFGLRLREDYLGRFEQHELWLSTGSGWHGDRNRPSLDGRLRIRNPVGLRAPGWTEEFALARQEGRLTAHLEGTRRFRTWVSDSTWRSVSAALDWLTVTDPRYLDPGYYDDAGTAELSTRGRLGRPWGHWPLQVEVVVAGGYAYPNRGVTVAGGAYGRVTLAASTRAPVAKSLSLGARLYVGAVVSADSVLRQRRIYAAAADPYLRFGSPFQRSRGSLFTRSGFYYQQPGGAGARGLDPRLSGDRMLGATFEMEYTLGWRLSSSLLNRAALAVFADVARGNGDLAPGPRGFRTVGDAGVGIRFSHRVGQTRFVTRFDFPFWVSHPALAQDRGPDQPLGFRWGVSFAPTF